jgi:hypothetical protein
VGENVRVLVSGQLTTEPVASKFSRGWRDSFGTCAEGTTEAGVTSRDHVEPIIENIFRDRADTARQRDCPFTWTEKGGGMDARWAVPS